ncbi:MAG: tetratricopeptide repeat protein [Planctomycetota bacterium]|jgi:tetratricopeptide (TPR) repeat protein
MSTRAKGPFTQQDTKSILLVLCCGLFVLLPGSAGARTPQAKKPFSGRALRSMARVYMSSGGYEKAQPDSELCACMLDLAYLYKDQGKLAQAETMCLSGLELQEKIHSPNHPYVAYTLRILGDIYQGQGRYREAENSLKRALTIMRGVSSEDASEVAPFKVDMARLLIAQGDLAGAESYFDEAIPVIERSYRPGHLYTAKVFTSVARLRVLQGRYVEAEELIGKALPVQERVYGPNHHFLVPVWLIKSRIYQAKGDMANAKKLLEKSLHIAENQTDPRSLLKVLETLVQLHRQSGNAKKVAKLQKRIEYIRARRRVVYAPVAKAVR